jgi:hypothetical protein
MITFEPNALVLDLLVQHDDQANASCYLYLTLVVTALKPKEMLVHETVMPAVGRLRRAAWALLMTISLT